MVTVDSNHNPLHGVVSVRLQILLVGTCRLCSSWSVTGQTHRNVIGQDPTCVDLHDTGLGLFGYGNFPEQCLAVLQQQFAVVDFSTYAVTGAQHGLRNHNSQATKCISPFLVMSVTTTTKCNRLVA